MISKAFMDKNFKPIKSLDDIKEGIVLGVVSGGQQARFGVIDEILTKKNGTIVYNTQPAYVTSFTLEETLPVIHMVAKQNRGVLGIPTNLNAVRPQDLRTISESTMLDFYKVTKKWLRENLQKK